MSVYDPSPADAIREIRMCATSEYQMGVDDFEVALAVHENEVRAVLRAALIESDELPPDCNGVCRTSAGVYATSNTPRSMVARPDPFCPLHGNGWRS